MPSLQRLRAVCVVFVVGFGGCQCVDLSSVSAFGCDDGVCPEGLMCCADSTCRASCEVSTGGGAGGGSGTTDGGPSCGPLTCPRGCCDQGVCRMGRLAAQCGSGGQACAECATGESCVDGACSSCLATCAGCCSGTTCLESPTALACGPSHGACSSCGLGADGCPSGRCSCGDAGVCGTGTRCEQGLCICDGLSCAEGCCTASGACLKTTQQGSSECGVGGASCAACDVPPSATCESETSRIAYRSPGLCSAGSCHYEPLQMTCSLACDGGLCVDDPCQGCLTPPAPACVGSQLRSFTSPGSCGPGGCDYAEQRTECPFGCQNGGCLPDPCRDVSCTAPPAARCDGNTRLTSSATGTCTNGVCSYAETLTYCPFGCQAATATCAPDPCNGVSCTTAPPATCSGTVRVGFLSPGACTNGTCSYPEQRTTCGSGCDGGQCLGDPCAGVSCTTPPSAFCLNGATARSFATSGTCSAQGCTYAPTDTACVYGCAGGACRTDPCTGVTCLTPPPTTCAGAQLRTFSDAGTCMSGACSYTPTDSACASPPAPSCTSPTALRSYEPDGVCMNGACRYPPTDTSCAFGCETADAGVAACKPDPCLGVACTMPPTSACLTSTIARTYANPGLCSGGTCGYGVIDVQCVRPPPPVCLDSSTLRFYLTSGRCDGGGCEYPPVNQSCGNGCADGGCVGDPCSAVACLNPPFDTCTTVNGVPTVRDYPSSGVCRDGGCDYTPVDTPCIKPPDRCSGSLLYQYRDAGVRCVGSSCDFQYDLRSCPFGCADGGCLPDPCQGVLCQSPPPNGCFGSSAITVYTSPGTCRSGACDYNFLVQNCTQPPPPACPTPSTVRTYATFGRCDAGTCNYVTFTDTVCNRPPSNFCSFNTAMIYRPTGTCTPGSSSCTYTADAMPCPGTCVAGSCR